MTLPARQRALAVAAFGTAVATGYVASLDDALEAQPVALAASTKPVAPGPAARSARGDWPPPHDEALRAWGDGLLAPSPAATARGVAAKAAAAGAAASASRMATPSEAPASPPPEPPPPWRLIGRVDEAGASRALLATPQQLLVVGEQETLQSRWRVERIDDEAVELRVLATGQVLRLAWEAPR